MSFKNIVSYILKHKFLLFFIVIVLLMLLVFLGINIYFSYIIEQKIPIITYHNILPDDVYNEINHDAFATKESTFEKQMKFLDKHNFKTLSLDEYYCWKKDKCKQPRKSVVIVFDDGFSSTYKYAAPILKKYNQKSTVFLVYSFINSTDIKDPNSYLSKEIIEQSKKEYPDMQFASHSYDMHISSMHGKRSKEEMQQDIDKVKSYGDLKYWAYPNGYSDSMYEELLKENGYKLAFGFGSYSNSSKSDNDFKVNRMAGGDILPEWKFELKMLYRY